MTLDARRAAFVTAFVYGEHAGNATASALAVGYRHPNTQGPRLLVNVGVQEAIAAATAERDAALKAEGLSNLQNRLDLRNELKAAVDTIRAERAADPKARLIPGGNTGLVVREYKTIPNADPDKPPMVVTVDRIDKGAIDSYLALAREQAIDKGEWKEGKDKTVVPDGGRIRRIVIEEIESGHSD